MGLYRISQLNSFLFRSITMFSVVGQENEVKTRMDIREALEKKVLTFMIASTYEAMPKQMALDRGISFTQLPSREWDENDPAANVSVLVLDYTPENPNPTKGNYNMADSKRDYTQECS